MRQHFTVLIEQGEDGAYIASIPSIKSCYTQGNTIPEVLEKIEEVAQLCLEMNEEELPLTRFIGVQQLEIAI